MPKKREISGTSVSHLNPIVAAPRRRASLFGRSTAMETFPGAQVFGCEGLSQAEDLYQLKDVPAARLDTSHPAAYIQCRYMATMTHVARWGNSLGLRIPKSVAREARIEEGDTVHVSVADGSIIVRPAGPRYSVDELVGRITSRNRHGESEWGTRVGDEVW